MVAALTQLQNAGVEARCLKIEGLDRREDCPSSPKRRDALRAMGCIILGRGFKRTEGGGMAAQRGRRAGIHWVCGGRTSFWEPLVAWRDDKIQRQRAVEDIAHNIWNG
jgi:hypothetical protein